jgi:hypothetical protein
VQPEEIGVVDRPLRVEEEMSVIERGLILSLQTIENQGGKALKEVEGEEKEEGEEGEEEEVSI